MRHATWAGALCAALLTAVAARGAEPAAFQPPQYAALRAERPPRIDGRLDEPVWFAAPALSEFHFTWFKDGVREPTVAKLLWDDEHLYIAHVCRDAHITARHPEHDGEIPKDDCFEIMIAPDPARPSFYYNVEWNVIGGYVDNHRPNGGAGPRVKWDAEGVRIAGQFVGTLNDDADGDEQWTVEVAIPWKNFAGVMPHAPPLPGDTVRANFNRHGGDTNMQYSQWSPGDTPEPAFHTPHRFGTIVLSERSSPWARSAETK